MLYGHGDNGYLHPRELLADFSSNVWHGGEPAGLKEHIFQRWGLVNKYPEVLAESLTASISRYHELDPENILINNGTTESIYLIAQLFQGRSSTIVFPSFAEYEDACRMHQHSLQLVPWQELEAYAERLAAGEQDRPEAPDDAEGPDNAPRPVWLNTDLLWIGNPNNPTGAVLPALGILVRLHPQIIFIIDEAFIEFTHSIGSSIGLIRELPNLVILRSLTKAYAIPGLRLGYIAAAREILVRLRAFKLPWSVNALALEAGSFIFDRLSTIRLPLISLLADKADFSRRVQETGIKVQTSHTHFFLCETAHGDAATLQHFLLNRHRLLIRNASNFRGLGIKHFRLATLATDKNHLLVNALKEWKEQQYT
ncbi:MAG TPA: aminotransferase class I/II-fold pyridoxal phosphate-dependent enzyme [Puia sp.]|nr:aminotransferase class I/II-fold pyridoxal phosphate-dependent enzyme [Puia sp.]